VQVSALSSLQFHKFNKERQMIEIWINIETVNDGSNFSKIHGPYSTEREAFEDSKDLSRLAGKTIYDFDQRKLAT